MLLTLRFRCRNCCCNNRENIKKEKESNKQKKKKENMVDDRLAGVWREYRNKSRHTHTHYCVCGRGNEIRWGEHIKWVSRRRRRRGEIFLCVVRTAFTKWETSARLLALFPYQKGEAFVFDTGGSRGNQKSSGSPLSTYKKKKEKENVDTPIYRLGNVCTDSHDSLAS